MPAPVPPAVAALLDVFRLGLVTGLWDQRPVVAWADARVLAEEVPPDYVLDLALSGHRSRNDLVTALAGYIGDPPPPASWRVVLGLLHRQYAAGTVPLQQVVRTMEWLQWHEDLPAAEAALLAGVDDEYELAVAGVRGPAAQAVSAVEQYVRWALAFYQPLGWGNQAEWDRLGPEIAARVQVAYEERSPYNPQNFS